MAVNLGGLAGTISSKASGMFGSVLKGGLIIAIVLLLGSVVLALAWYVRYKRQFDIDVEVKSLRSSGVSGSSGFYKVLRDKGALLFDKKDKTWRFRLWDHKVDLSCPPYEVYQIGEGGKNLIKIWQKSQDEYYYLLPDTIDLTTIIKNGVSIPIGQQKMKVIEGDVSYWAQLRKRQNKQLFDIESTLMKVLPYIGMAFIFLLSLFAIYFLVGKLNVLSEVAKEFRLAAEVLAKSNANTATVTPVS